MKYNFSFIISGIEPEPSDTSFEATDLPIENSSQEQQQSQEILEDDPACSVGEPQKEIEKPATNEETPQKTVDESSSLSTVQSNHGEFRFVMIL